MKVSKLILLCHNMAFIFFFFFFYIKKKKKKKKDNEYVNIDLVFLFIIAYRKIYISGVCLLVNTTTAYIKYNVLYDPTFSW